MLIHRSRLRRRTANLIRGAGSLLLASLLLVPMSAGALGLLTSRSLTLGSSAISVSTSYNFKFSPVSVTVIKSIDFQFCTTASGTCTTPTGINLSGAALNGAPTNLGNGTWSVNGTPPAGHVQISNSTNTGAPAANATVNFNGIVNPSATGTFFVRITTYSDSAWTTALDNGTVAGAVTNQITVTATVDETLTFCVGVTVTSNCSSTTGTTVNLGTLTTSTTGSGTSQMAAATNGSGGYTITYSGTTLTSGANTIAAMGTQSTNGSATASSAGTSQFGMNLTANTAPTVGSNISHLSAASIGAQGTNYGIANNFRFFSGDTVGTTGGLPSDFDTYTVSYIANISGVTASGNYSTTLTYICTAQF